MERKGAKGAPPAASWVKYATALSNLRLCSTTRPSARPSPAVSRAGDIARQRTAEPCLRQRGADMGRICDGLRRGGKEVGGAGQQGGRVGRRVARPSKVNTSLRVSKFHSCMRPSSAPIRTCRIQKTEHNQINPTIERTSPQTVKGIDDQEGAGAGGRRVGPREAMSEALSCLVEVGVWVEERGRSEVERELDRPRLRLVIVDRPHLARRGRVCQARARVRVGGGWRRVQMGINGGSRGGGGRR